MALFFCDVCEDEKHVIDVRMEMVRSPHGGEKIVRTAEAQKKRPEIKRRAEGGEEG